MAQPIAGVLPIAHTPFLDDDSIDLASLKRQIDWAYAVGANGFGTGMVSELLRLTFNERIALTDSLAELNAGRGTFFAGVGAESTRQALEYAVRAEQAGADAVMAIPPISTRLPISAVRDYFIALAEGVGIPVIVQDASGYVGQPIPIPVCVELMQRFGRDKILFKPEASPIGPNLSALRDATGGQARIYEGSGGVCLVDSYRRGITGTMPGMEFLPAIVALWKALARGDEDATYRLYFPICALVSLQLQAGLDGFLAVEKYVLHKQGIFATDRRRQPSAWSLDDETRAELDRLLDQLDAAVTPTELDRDR
ncbi:MAG: dihydrodipicolinate synthase family protein [Planctomycetes bacterium]|nr:dihydrodipicolinate synthase family protein [Planctomycetota bacterium]